MSIRQLRSAVVFCILLSTTHLNVAAAQQPDASVLSELKSGLTKLQTKVDELKKSVPDKRSEQALLADVSVFAKAVEWMLRHNEFPKKDYASQAARAIETGLQRARELADGRPGWISKPGVTIRGYVSKVDDSIQPYAVTLPEGVDPQSGARWPLHVKLHGRANDMNEVNFIHRHNNKPLPKGQDWIQLDVYGRGNNAYRWAGETDVFEAMTDVTRRFRIDTNRVTLHGFSMGGAGAWHLGLHHPAMWSSVGPGAGFVDFYKYQKQTEKRPPWQHATLGIYDAIDYSLNAANVPVCTYGGEKDAQLIASTSVVEKAKSLGVDIKLLIGPGMGHRFHPDSFKEFMAFHKARSAEGRVRNTGRKSIRFTTKTLKYNRCDWATIEEVEKVYEPSTIEAEIGDDGNVKVSTENIAVLSLARDVASFAVIDGDFLPCYDAAEGLLPNVYYEKTGDGWIPLTYGDSRVFQDNPDINKRHGLQGPIDDAFMEPFVCVTGSGQTTATSHQQWTEWTKNRFSSEFDKWMRATVGVIPDTEVNDDIIASKNLILFGDPSSNRILAKVLPKLPVRCAGDTLTIAGKSYSTANHGLSMIYPNPLNPRKYVVINSGHTFHEADFRNSNSWLFPRLGDIAVQKFEANADGGFDEVTVWAANFNSGWKMPNN